MASTFRSYQIHYHSLSNHHKFDINNQHDEQLYTVHWTPLSLSTKLIIHEAVHGKELIKIRENKSHHHILYDIFGIINDNGDEKHLATVKRLSCEHHCKGQFEITSGFGLYTVEDVGEPFGSHLILKSNGKTVMNMTKSIKSRKLGKKYHVEVNDDVGGDLFLLSLIISLWCAMH